MVSSDNRQHLESPKSSLRLATTKALGGSLMASVLFGDQDTWSLVADPAPRKKSPARSQIHSLSLRVVLATAISVVAILASLSVCKYLRNKERWAGAAHRRLAEGGEDGDEQALSIIESCLDLEADMGLLHQRAVSSSRRDSQNRVTELISMLSEAAAEKESIRGNFPVGTQLPSSRQSLADQGSFGHGYGEQVHLKTTPLGAFVEHDGFHGVNPSLDPDSWMDAIPTADLLLDEQEGAGSFSVVREEAHTGNSSVLHKSKLPRLGNPSDMIDSGSLREMLLSGGIRNHPYVRLPVLENGVVPRSVRTAVLLSAKPRRFSFHDYLLSLRELFLKETLNQQDAEKLVTAVELLVVTSWFQSRRGIRTNAPIAIVEGLGRYMMIFDALVCAKEILGDFMPFDHWWDKFANSFKTDISIPPAGSRGGRLANIHRNLARRLVAALDIYKRGERPHHFEVLELKRLLFCSESGRHRLKDRQWIPWIHDGGCL